MKPSPFVYHAPATVADAAGVLREHADEAKVLAGGQSLVPMMSLRLASFGHLVDLNRVTGLDEITRSNGHVRVGALVRQSVAEHDPTVGTDVPMLARALPHIGHFQIRNRGTVGGSIAHADPASELPAVVCALDAILEASSADGSRDIAAADFFESTWQTALADDEILTAVRFPVWSGRSGFAVEEVTRRHGDFAICGAVCGVQRSGDSVTRAAIALFGVGATPIRAREAEAALVAAGAGADLAAIGQEAAAGLEPGDDLHASGAYRRTVGAVVVRRALSRALEEAGS
ncbi:MAG: xanthine dehydrogenase family protein subunit M [Ilumatobacteraceae bacterium]